MGGDITGKMIVPIVDRGQGLHTATLYGRNLQVTDDGLAKLRKTIADAGYYAYGTTPEEMERFRAEPDAVTELFGLRGRHPARIHRGRQSGGNGRRSR